MSSAQNTRARTRNQPVARTRNRLLLSIGGAVVSLGVLIVAGVVFWGDIAHAIRLAPFLALVALVLLQAATLWLRAEAWGMNIKAAGGRLTRAEVQAASALTFLASNFLPALVPNLVRIGVLRRLRPDSEATMSVMVGADGVALVIEVLINAGFIAAAIVFLPSVSRWWSLLVLALPAAAVAFVWVLRRHFRQRRFMRAFDVMDQPRKLGILTAFLSAVLVLQPARYYIAFHALGLHASVSQALLAFVASNLISVLPFISSTASTVAAPAAVLGATNPSVLPAAVGAGAVLAATTLGASLLVASWTPLVLHRLFSRRRPPPAPVPADAPQAD